jgi:hypothetical protein
MTSSQIQEALKSQGDVKILLDCFAKGVLNAKIIMNDEGVESKGRSIFSKLTVGAINKRDDEILDRG